MNIRFLSKGSPDQISGGYLYNKYLLDYLRQKGIAVSYEPDATVTGIGAADIVVVDSIVLDQIAAELLSIPAELVLLLHMVPRFPTGDSKATATLRSLCRRACLVVTGESTLASLRQVLADPHLDAVKIEPGVRGGWRAKSDYSERARTLLGVANYVEGKGISQMVEVLRQLKDLPWTLTLHGNRDFDPAYFEAVAEAVEAYGLSDRIELLGPVPHDVINDKMLQSDLLVHFSRRESYSMVTAEAIASGLPVVSYRTGNFGVFGRSGLVRYLEGGDACEASTLAALIDDENAYGRLRPTGIRPTRTWQDVGREFIDCLG